MLSFLFGSALRAKIIAWLTTHSGQRYFVRELTSILDEDSTNVSRELARLAEHNLLNRFEEGRQVYYQANREHPIFEELRSISVKFTGVGDIILEALSPVKEKIDIGFIFGSVAEGKEIAASDIDLAIIGDVTLSEISPMIGPVEEKLDRAINPVVYTVGECKQKLAKGDHFLDRLVHSSKIFLIGDKHELEKVLEK